MKTESSPRSYWPLGITTFFALALIFLVAFVVWACRQGEELVTENYYEHEVRYQQQMDQVRHTQPIEAQVAVAFDAVRGNIAISLPAAQAISAVGQIQLYRPSDPRLDRSLPLAVDAQGFQQLDAKHLATGLWKIRVKWTADGEEYYVDRAVVVGKAS